ncbi:NAD kinase-like isoform X2 [Littorina saxatilis]|uniref:NAD kinase-like isoform X2 n=1 Tax=Littorina saxatilis TaxID=31220 RepID=UPI0038B58C90
MPGKMTVNGYRHKLNGHLHGVSSAVCRKIPDPSSQRLNWVKTPLSVLIIKKPFDPTVTHAFRDLVLWLIQEKSLLVFVEENVVKDEVLAEDYEFINVQDKLQKFREGVDDLEDKVDFIVCLGGDGTLLYASSLFQQSVPPVIAFNMGSLGFLTPFPFDSFKDRINHILKGQAPLLLRYRLKCVMMNHMNKEEPSKPIPHVKNIDKNQQNISTHILVLNEVVIDRGPSSYLCNLDLYIEGHLVTSVLGDGLIISTPTGSTAYSVAAGASMIHPNVPCILITPICPHSLSFRPIVVPAGAEIKVTLAPEARGHAMVSFDGRNRQEMGQGSSLRITTAAYPVPSICARDQIDDWFSGLADCLHWNVRKPQKPLSTCTSLTSLDSLSMDFDHTK